MPAPYLDLAGLREVTLAPASYVDAIEAEEPGWVLGMLGRLSRWIDARLRKRYAAPFADGAPDAVLGWLEALATWEILLKRGVNPTDEQTAELKARRDEAKAEVLEAATGDTGRFDLPVLQAGGASAIAGPMAIGQAEASPYTWTDVQLQTAIDNGESGFSA